MLLCARKLNKNIRLNDGIYERKVACTRNAIFATLQFVDVVQCSNPLLNQGAKFECLAGVPLTQASQSLCAVGLQQEQMSPIFKQATNPASSSYLSQQLLNSQLSPFHDSARQKFHEFASPKEISAIRCVPHQ
jgi:hypothetical protein